MILGAIALAIIVTWPVVTNLSTEIAGVGSGGDRSGYAWDVWYLQQHGLDIWGANNQTGVSEPFGRTLPAALNTLQITFFGPAWFFSQFVGPITALNLALIFVMAMSTAAMYLLVRVIGLGAGPALWAATAFSIFPNALIRASTHYPLAAMACIPLILLAAWSWHRQPGLRGAVLVAAALAFCWLSNPYYGTMGFVIVAVVGVAGLIKMIASGGPWTHTVRRCAELVGSVLLIVVVPLALLFWSARNVVETTLARPRVALDLYGARLSDYVAPDFQQEFFVDLFGADRLASLGAPGGERANFVGYLTLALALVAVGFALRRWPALSAIQRSVVATAVPLIVVLVWFSLATPTRWFGFTIPTPSDAVFDVLPFLRVYARFAVAAVAVLLVVSAAGLWSLTRDRSVPIRSGAVVLALVISLLELPVGGGFPVGSDRPLVVGATQPDKVPMWQWLRDESAQDALIYNFPAGHNELLERFHMYGQVVHERPIVNGDAPGNGIGSDVTSGDVDPREPESAGRLRGLGVDLVTVHPLIYGVVGLEAPPAKRPPPGYAVAAAFSDGSAVWRVTAKPDHAVAIFRRATWWPPERLDDDREWRYLNQEGDVSIFAPRPGRYRISFGLESLEGQSRALEMRFPGGQTKRVTPGNGNPVSVVVELPEGRSDVVIVNRGVPPRQISAEDLRVVGLRVSDWSIQRIDAE